MKPDKPETARSRRARTSKFRNRDPNYRKGNFAVLALYYGHDTAQSAPTDNLSKALAHYAALSIKSNILVLKLVEYTTVEGSNETKTTVLHQLHKTNQRFLNSKKEMIWREPGKTVEYTEEGLAKQRINRNGLELARVIYTDGSPWWERAH